MHEFPLSKHKLLEKDWTASWISFPDTPSTIYGVYYFRKRFRIDIIPASFPIYVSSDNFYNLFINGIPANTGMVRSDLTNWYYDTIDLAPYLVEGWNTLAIQVSNMNDHAATAQITKHTSILIQGNGIDTDNSWKVNKSVAHKACSTDNLERLGVFMVTGPGDEIDGNKYLWGWEQSNFNDTEWDNATRTSVDPILNILKSGHGKLSARPIPLLRNELIRFLEIRRIDGLIQKESTIFLSGTSPLIIPQYSMVSILVDQGYHTVAYPELILSGGKNAKVKLTYAESLFDKADKKGNRNEVTNKHIKGNYDLFITDGGTNRLYRPTWFRTYRYIQMDIWTQDEELTINDFYGGRTGYPMSLNADFKANDPSLAEIWQIGWRTLQNCAGDSFYDTPYYEQLQYVADSRIQALIMLYTSGDDRLMRKCIVDLYNSRTSVGLTQSRYPCKNFQIIPAFSLFWISMIHDYWIHRKNDEFVVQFLPQISFVLQWFDLRIDTEKKMLGPLTWWNFVDWDNFNSGGTAPGARNGNSSIISLQFAYTLEQAAELLIAFNNERQGEIYREQAIELKENTYLHCFDLKRCLIADTPEKTSYSQHAGIWAILSGAVKAEAAKQLMKQILFSDDIAKVTYFYRFYLTQALKKAGMADLYYSMLTPWHDMIALGLTTFAEKPEPTRSDCHGWSASPSYDFLATICGIMPGSPGFATVLIAPALGELTEVSGKMPHPAGSIAVEFKRQANGHLSAIITLPPTITGNFIWNNKTLALHGGLQDFII